MPIGGRVNKGCAVIMHGDFWSEATFFFPFRRNAGDNKAHASIPKTSDLRVKGCSAINRCISGSLFLGLGWEWFLRILFCLPPPLSVGAGLGNRAN